MEEGGGRGALLKALLEQQHLWKPAPVRPHDREYLTGGSNSDKHFCEISATLMGGISGSNSLKLGEVNKAEKEPAARKDKITPDPPDTES